MVCRKSWSSNTPVRCVPDYDDVNRLESCILCCFKACLFGGFFGGGGGGGLWDFLFDCLLFQLHAICILRDGSAGRIVCTATLR